jgi:hypothetical protein
MQLLFARECNQRASVSLCPSSRKVIFVQEWEKSWLGRSGKSWV